MECSDEQIREFCAFLESAWSMTLLSCGGLLPREAWNPIQTILLAMVDAEKAKYGIKDFIFVCDRKTNPPRIEEKGFVRARALFRCGDVAYREVFLGPWPEIERGLRIV